MIGWIGTFLPTWQLLLLAGALLLTLQQEAGELLQLLPTFTFELGVYPQNLGTGIERAALTALEQVLWIHIEKAGDDEKVIAPWLRLQPAKPRIETMIRDPGGPTDGLSVRGSRVDLTL